MQPRPLVAIHGTVLNIRHVEIPARPATDTARAYDGGTYEEVTLSVPECELDGEQVEGIVAYETVRFSSDEPTLGELVPGTEVYLLCSKFVETFRSKGKWSNVAAYRFSRLAQPIRQARSLTTASA